MTTHHLFTHCYPTASIIPKMHYMVHFPHQIIRYLSFRGVARGGFWLPENPPWLKKVGGVLDKCEYYCNAVASYAIYS